MKKKPVRKRRYPFGRDSIRPEETVSVRKRQYPSGIDRIRCLKRYLRQLTFVIDVIDVDDGDERLDLKRSSEIGLARADNSRPILPSKRSKRLSTFLMSLANLL